MDAAVATWRHWLPKREGTHVCGEDRRVATVVKILILYLQK